MADLKDILNHDEDPRDEDLLRYLQGDVSREEAHRVERQMADSEFVNDAMEGLQNIRNKKSIDEYVDELNRNLQKQVVQKKQRREKRKLKDQPWIIIALVVVLALCVIGYAVIRYHQAQQVPSRSPQQKTINN